MILVTGGTGFLGSRVVRALTKTNTGKIRCFVRNDVPENIFDSLVSGNEKKNIELFRGSFNNLEDCERSLDGVNAVVHLAASTSGSVPVQISNTVLSSENLFKACKNSNIKRIVLCSSLGVLKASVLKKNAVVDEDCPFEDKPELRDPYSYAKIIQEQVAWEYYNRDNLPLVVVRPSVIFGPPQPILSSRIGICLFGFFLHLGGHNIIPLTYKDNCADAIIQSALVDSIEGEIFHITDDDLPVSAELLNLYKKNIGSIRSISFPYFMLKQVSKINLWYSKRTNGHLPNVFTPYKVDTMWKGHTYSNAKAKKLLGWEPRISMKDALENTMKFERENKK